MIVVDSSGWLEYLANGPNSEKFAPAIEDVENLIVPSISLYEVFRKTLADRGEGEALQVAAQLHQCRLVDLDSTLSLFAAQLSHQLKLPMADSIILATARQNRAELWTQDSDFEGIKGVRYFPKKYLPKMS